MNVKSYKEALRPYRDVIIFMLTLFAVNYFWKFTVSGDEFDEQVTWFGLDITAPFEFMACHVASAVYWLVSLFRDDVTLISDHTIRFPNGVGTTIVWGCSGLKQMFIWTFLILTIPNVRKSSTSLLLHKLWFIPLGWLCCHAFNILRIFLITILIEDHPTWFNFLHDYLFKYAFYGMLFLLWVVFIEKIRPSQETD